LVDRDDLRQEHKEDPWKWMGQRVELVFDEPNARSIEGVLRGHTHTGVFLEYTDEGSERHTIFTPWTAVRLLRLE
jgi:hypothetical protein